MYGSAGFAAAPDDKNSVIPQEVNKYLWHFNLPSLGAGKFILRINLPAH
jgi:hypothetical protein